MEYGKLYLCATPIGNLEDISIRTLNILKSVDLIACEDTRHSLKMLTHFEISKPLTSYFEHNKTEKGLKIIEKIKEGKNVALITDAGTPAISDPGEDLVRLCAENGVDVVPVPGPAALINALIVSGLPTGRFSFEGFLSVNKKSRADHLDEVKNDTRTLIFYEAPHKLLRTLNDMSKVFGDRKIALVREITKIHEEVKRTTLFEAVKFYTENPPKGEFVLVIEGKSYEELSEEKAEEFENISVTEQINALIGERIDKKDAIKQVAVLRNMKKRDVYNEYVKNTEGEF
ncbi:16S rRNA (cytidine(1402)-2'-O)-methyltransferase [Qingrenia yutianensis]|uniref:Ribosomal RNA small subunit methyltransferase I n=1 Tax=Qingrenia yutianensis TaxID=2763676 RepID=A0A926F7N7_9FIRM|nr:16S rRNA (cytidine(1402)-2'-O)-methyltransferase [Qingrenia yutianensis]MBC8595490.1 16S rRNA (cytidine(1402)-2'-O)-methyltransferase [Qingrenia yutianensis]